MGKNENVMEGKVKEAYRQDIGRGIVRVGSAIMEELDIGPGDAISIKGKKEAVALVWSELSTGEEDYIRMDGILRNNCGAGIDDEVKIEAIELKEAKTLQLSPTQEIDFNPDFIEYVHERILNMPLLQGNSLVIGVMGKQLQLVVSKIEPAPSRIIWDTKIQILKKPVKGQIEKQKILRYEDVGGLQKEIEAVREMVEIPIKNPEIFNKLGVEPPKGVLLYGPPGTGKTLLAKAVANETDAHFITLNGPEIMSKFYGQSEENLRKIFDEAKQNAPTIIFIDEIDAIAPNRNEVQGEVERRVVSQLLTLMDGLEARGNIIVMASTNRPDSLDPALRRPGRFDREIVIGMPNRDGRKEILQIHTRNMPLDKGINLDEIADITIGYTGADLSALSKEAAMRSLREVMPDLKKLEGKLSKEVLDKLKITKEHFNEAARIIEPSAMREVSVEIPRVNWNDIGGLDEVKQTLKETVEWPNKYPKMFETAGIKPPKGILLFGPPGTGKTLFAKAVANEVRANFITVKGPELLSKWVGESEKGIRQIFHKARQVAPSIIFFDEIDALVTIRGRSHDSGVSDKVTAQLLTEIDGVSKFNDVLIMASTNRPDLLDKALLRPGRFDRLIFVDMPDKKARTEIFKVHTQNMSLSKNVNAEKLAEKTEGYNGADIEAVCREAGMIAIRDAVNKKKKDIEFVDKTDFDQSIEKIKPSYVKEDKDRWQDIEKKMAEIVR